MMRQKRFGIAVAVCVSAMSLTGCLKAVGGGKITLPNGGSITTGFQLRCEDVAPFGFGHITGQFQYQDHGMNVAFHMDIDQPLLDNTGQPVLVTCEALDQLLTGIGGVGSVGMQRTFSVIGTYTPQPQNLGIGGQVQVTIQDGPNYFSLAGCDPGDDALVVQIDFNDPGVYHGYNQQGCLSKGNFTVFTE